MCIRLWHAPRISRKFAGEWKFVLECYGHNENRTGYHPALVPLFSLHVGIHSAWEDKQRDALVVGSFTPGSLFVYENDQFANLSVPFQNAMPLDTHQSAKPSGVLRSPSSLSNFLKIASSSDLAASSESLLIHISTEAFICAKLKHLAWKTLLSSFKWGGNVDKTKAHAEIFCFLESQYNNAHSIIVIFWKLLQLDPNSQNLTPSSHCRLTWQPPCFACALQLPTFCLCFLVWCIARQADRNSETAKHPHNCIKVLSQFRTPSGIILRQYSNRPKWGVVPDNAQIPRGVVGRERVGTAFREQRILKRVMTYLEAI